MKTIVFIEASIHNSVASPWYIGEEDEDGSFVETGEGCIKAGDTAGLKKLYARADEVWEVEYLRANTNKRRVK
jgi:hypothetical protein